MCFSFCFLKIKDLILILIRWGGNFLITSFQEQTGHAFTKTQFKNKWDGCKKDWRIWNKLVFETSIGWSSELGTISASDEWWKEKIQVNSPSS